MGLVVVAIVFAVLPLNNLNNSQKLSETSTDTIHLKLSTLERDIRTTTKSLRKEELLQKILTELGVETLEVWANNNHTGDAGYGSSEEEWGKIYNEWKKVDDLVSKYSEYLEDIELQNYFEDFDESSFDYLGNDFAFWIYVLSQGYREDEYLEWKYGEPKPTLASTQSNPQKDFTNARYTDDFVKKYALNKKFVKTEADKAFEKKWNEYLILSANQIQQETNGYNSGDTKYQMLMIGIDTYSAFLSYNCMSDYFEKVKQYNYVMEEFRRAKMKKSLEQNKNKTEETINIPYNK